jgi:elongation factor 1-gamma
MVQVLDPGFRKQFANVNRWFQTVVNQPQAKEVLGEIKLCEKMQVAKEAPAAEPKEKKAKEPKAQQPKQEKKKEEKPKEEEQGDEDEEEKPKAKNPLDLLPPSSFVLDEWKRTYSNNDTKTVAIPWYPLY